MQEEIDSIVSVPYKPRSLRFSPDGQVLVISGKGPNVLFWCMTSGMLVDIPVGVGVADTAFLCPIHKRRQMIAMLTIEPKSRIVTVDCSSKYLPSSRVLSCETTAHSTQVKTPRLSMVAHSNCTIFATSAGTEVKTWEVSHDSAAFIPCGTAETVGGIDDICDLHFMSNSDSLLVTYCYHKEIYSSAISPCENYIIIHDSHKVMELWHINSWERELRWELSIPQKDMWKKYPIVLGTSRVYIAGAEGQIIARRPNSDSPHISTVAGGRIFAMTATTAGPPFFAAAFCAALLPTSYLVEVWADKQCNTIINPTIRIHNPQQKRRHWNLTVCQPSK
ncbi:hypothetical protein PILCRDRAFT_804607 [Piloderma croceum F 1598]|uniref:Uncharacterized protein n=1 Tax=Piloderma croceum (strain F 1598) TaxID=765440 RepID=A0A0C3ADB8_PILCF|nr:hypothetical protein PILCRDRAFT_804607 [Piloderma croceum F 1598]